MNALRTAGLALGLLAGLGLADAGCGHDGSPGGVVRAYADALDAKDGELAANYLAPTFGADAARWLPVYARVIEKYGVEILQETVSSDGVEAEVKVRERADLVVGGEDRSEVVFTLHWMENHWRIVAIADATAKPPASGAPDALPLPKIR